MVCRSCCSLALLVPDQTFFSLSDASPSSSLSSSPSQSESSPSIVSATTASASADSSESSTTAPSPVTASTSSSSPSAAPTAARAAPPAVSARRRHREVLLELFKRLHAAKLPPAPPSSEVVSLLVDEVKHYMYSSSRACCVCAQWTHPEDSVILATGSLPRSFFTVLKAPSSGIHDSCKQQYNIAELLPVAIRSKFEQLLLWHKGVVNAGHADASLCFCKPCINSLRRSSQPSCKKPLPPRLAIANGFFIGSSVLLVK